jgi:hypothetical protein
MTFSVFNILRTCVPFKIKGKINKVHMNTQEQLFKKINEFFPNATAKKINKDYFLDIIPKVSKNPKDCLFFNTKNEAAIKLGFTTSDKAMTDQIAKVHTDFVAFSGGIKSIKEGTLEEILATALELLMYINKYSNSTEEVKLNLSDNAKPVESINESKSTDNTNAIELVQEIPPTINKNPDVNNLGNLFVQKKYDLVCHHADLSMVYSNNTFDKIISASLLSGNSEMFQACKDKYDTFADLGWKIRKGNGDFAKKWEEIFKSNSNLLKHEIEYSGEFNNNNKYEGKGILKNLKTGIRYEGEFYDGKRQGHGKQTWQDGKIYEGGWMNDKRYGKGIMKLPNDDKYEGDWINDERNGFGKFLWADGQIYEGQWKDDLKHGTGKIKFTDGSTYEGDWINGNRTGKAIKQFSGGDEYEGDFVYGLRHGKGKYKWSNGCIYEGDFVDDKFTGKGKYIWADGGIYEGDFVDGNLTGKGKRIWASGNTYEGDFIENKRTGKGKYTWSGGVDEGDFVDGNLTGKGKRIWTSGDTYEGDFKDNKINGNGKIKFKNGDWYDGEWINGVRNGSGKSVWEEVKGEEIVIVTYEGEYSNGEIKGNGKLYFESAKPYAKFNYWGHFDQEKAKGKLYNLIDGNYTMDTLGIIIEYWVTNNEKIEAGRINKSDKSLSSSSKSSNSSKQAYEVRYVVRLKENKSEIVVKGSVLGTIFGNSKLRLADKQTHGKGQSIEKVIYIDKAGGLSKSEALNEILQNDSDVKSGKAGTSTISIKSIEKYK